MIAVEDLKSFLKITTSAYDAILEDLEEEAVSIAERFVGWKITEPEDETFILPGSGTTVLFLPERPTSDDAGDFSIYERANEGATETLIDPDDDAGYVVRGRRIVRKNGMAWSAALEYVITTEVGYATADVPGYIRRAVRALVAWAWNSRGKSGLKSEAIGGYSYSLSDAGESDLLKVPEVAALRMKRRQRA